MPWFVAAAGVLAEADADASLTEVLAAALEANARQARLAEELRAGNARLRGENEQLRVENARLRERDAQRDVELEQMAAELAVLKRMVFGRSSERSRPEPSGRGADGAGNRGGAGGGKPGRPRGPGARAGRRDYSRLPRAGVIWDFPGGGYCCLRCGEAVHPAG